MKLNQATGLGALLIMMSVGASPAWAQGGALGEAEKPRHPEQQAVPGLDSGSASLQQRLMQREGAPQIRDAIRANMAEIAASTDRAALEAALAKCQQPELIRLLEEADGDVDAVVEALRDFASWRFATVERPSYLFLKDRPMPICSAKDRLQPGQTVRVLAVDGGWVQVREGKAPFRSGWVRQVEGGEVLSAIQDSGSQIPGLSTIYLTGQMGDDAFFAIIDLDAKQQASGNLYKGITALVFVDRQRLSLEGNAYLDGHILRGHILEDKAPPQGMAQQVGPTQETLRMIELTINPTTTFVSGKVFREGKLYAEGQGWIGPARNQRDALEKQVVDAASAYLDTADKQGSDRDTRFEELEENLVKSMYYDALAGAQEKANKTGSWGELVELSRIKAAYREARMELIQANFMGSDPAGQAQQRARARKLLQEVAKSFLDLFEAKKAGE
jgi:hypothetical protein